MNIEQPLQAVVLPGQEPPQGYLKITAVTAARLCVHFVVLVLIFFVLVGPVQTFMHYFEQEDLKLPAMTVLVALAARRMNTHFFVILPALLVMDFVTLLVLQFPPRPWRILARLWFVGVLLAAFLFLVLGMFAMAIPIDANLKPGERVFPYEEAAASIIEAGNQ